MTEHDTQLTEMPPTAHVLLTVVYDSGMDERMTALIEDLHLDGWTKMFAGHGFGGKGRKQDTPVWPGTVNMFLIVLEESDLERVVTAIRALESSYRRNPGVTLWTQPVTLL
jgi:hypothetical protein